VARKRYLESDFFEGYTLIGIVCSLPDFRVSFFINRHLHLALKKYAPFSLNPEEKPVFSWYHHAEEALRRDFFLIQNKNNTTLLLPSLTKFDYILLVYGNIPDSFPEKILSALRATPYISAAFEQELSQLKNSDLLIERNEQHATEQLNKYVIFQQKKSLLD